MCYTRAELFCAHKLNIVIENCNQEVDLASSDKTVKITGMCTVDIHLHGHKYESVRLGVMQKLCSDLLLGQDFQKQHQNVVIEYSGPLPDLNVGNKKDPNSSSLSNSEKDKTSACNVTAALLGPVSLFENLSSDCRPVAVKSRRYNKADKKFIDNEIKQMLQDGIIQHSASPWRAQVVVTHDESNPH